jgi:hypothetical protein
VWVCGIGGGGWVWRGGGVCVCVSERGGVCRVGIVNISYTCDKK